MGAAAAMIGVAGASAAGSALSAKSAQPKATPVPKPNALFPGIQESYLNAMTSSGITPASFGTLTDAATTGLPTDVGPAFEALKSSMGRGLQEGRANLIEQYGSQGLRFSQPLLNATVDYESQTQKDFASILADYTRQATEAAANRRVAAATFGAQTGSDFAGAFTPSAVITSGAPSPLGSAIQSGASSVQNIVLMKALFPDLFKT